MKTSVRAVVEAMFQRRRQCLTAGQVLINRAYTHQRLNERYPIGNDRYPDSKQFLWGSSRFGAE